MVGLGFFFFFSFSKEDDFEICSRPINNCRKALELEPDVKHLLKCFLESEPSMRSLKIWILSLHLQVLQVEVAIVSKNRLVLL